MATTPFGEPDTPTDDWVDVRMTDPDAGEWDVDLVVLDGQVEYVDLRIQPTLLASFIDCLLDDVSDEQAEAIVATLTDENGDDQ